MQGLLGIRTPYAEAANVIPLFSVLYFLWIGVEIALFVNVLMWVLLLFCSLPMLAYLEAMKARKGSYETGLKGMVKSDLVAGGEYLARLRALLPGSGLLIILVIGHYLLYLVVIGTAIATKQYLLLGAQIALFSYVLWLFVFLRIHMRNDARSTSKSRPWVTRPRSRSSETLAPFCHG